MEIEFNNKTYTEEELEEKMKKGIISLEEYDDLVGDKMREEIIKKAWKEYDEYKAKLLELPKEVIIESSYETAVKREFVDELQFTNLSIDETKALVEKDHLLNFLYNDWLDYDCGLYESLTGSFEISVGYLTKRYKEDHDKQKEIDK